MSNMVPWPWGVISSGRGIGVSGGELLDWDDVTWDGIISSDESVPLTSEVLLSGGHPGVGTMWICSWGIDHHLGVSWRDKT